MSVALFDLNFLVALAWPHHQFHPIANSWFNDHNAKGWATCTATQLGFIRLSSNPAYLQNATKTPEEARQLLAELIKHPHHRFLSDLEPPVYFPEITSLLGHQQLTDAYLIGMARLTHSRLVTFDKRLASLATNKSLIEIILPSIDGQ
jgi:toxin-antitoxin system PIN domain toxin